MYWSLFLVSLCILTLRLPQFFMVTGVDLSSQNIFQVDQSWYIAGGGVATEREFMFILQQ